MTTIRIGTRGSALALWQAKYVANALESAHAGLNTELTIYKTKGDHILDRPLAEIGGKGLFTKELEVGLLNHDVDIAVHSLKDMPTGLPEGLTLGSIPKRGDVRDCLLRRRDEMGHPNTVGTASLRRGALGKRRFPKTVIKSIRGNVETRLNRLFSDTNDRCDAVILAMAGLIRLKLNQTREDVDFLPLNPEIFIPAAGQGALAIECRESDVSTIEILQAIHDAPTAACVTAERSFLAGVEGSCRVPVGAYATMDRSTIRLRSFVSDIAGEIYLEDTRMGTDAITLGESAASALIERGAKEILESLQQK